MLIGLCVVLALWLGYMWWLHVKDRETQKALVGQMTALAIEFDKERHSWSELCAQEQQARDDAALAAREAEANALEALDTKADEVAGVMACVWKDLGLNPEQFAPEADLTRTGRLHEILHFTAERMNKPPCLRTVRDAVLALARAAD